MTTYKHALSRFTIFALASILLVSTVLSLLFASKAGAAPTITITSPTSNQQIPGTNFTVAGTATPNTTVVVSNNGTSFAQTISDSSGKWSINSSLPAGNVKITAKAIENPEYGYFPTTSLDFSSTNINRMRLSDNVINPGGGSWPVNTPRFLIGLIPSPLGKTLYTSNAFNPTSVPEKFDASNPAEPVPATGTFPTNPQVNKGDYNSDGTKYYAGSISANNVVMVVDVASNSHLTDINMGGRPITIWRGPNNKIYAAMNENQIKIINPTTDTVESTVNIPCSISESVAVASFSQDNSYPYYFVPCNNSGEIVKVKISDNSIVSKFSIGGNPVTSALSLDNKRLFISNLTGTDDRAKMRVINTEDGSLITTISLTGGALGFIPTADFQKIIIATPESLTTPNTFDVQNIDIIDTTTYQLTPVATTGIATAVTFSPSDIAEADVDVSFVLGAATTASGTLAETGALAISAILLLGIILGIIIYLYSDYRKHKRPLTEINPNVHYTFGHHIRVVSIPLLRYRLTFSVSKQGSKINRF